MMSQQLTNLIKTNEKNLMKSACSAQITTERYLKEILIVTNNFLANFVSSNFEKKVKRCAFIIKKMKS